MLGKTVLIDFGGMHLGHKHQVLHYVDLSPLSNVREASSKLYDTLRSAEAVEGAKIILITDLSKAKGGLIQDGLEAL